MSSSSPSTAARVRMKKKKLIRPCSRRRPVARATSDASSSTVTAATATLRVSTTFGPVSNGAVSGASGQKSSYGLLTPRPPPGGERRAQAGRRQQQGRRLWHPHREQGSVVD